MDPSFLLDSVLRSVMGGRGKTSRHAMRYLTGKGGRSFLSNPATLLTAAGVAWGIYESLQNTGGGGAQGGFGPSGATAHAGGSSPSPAPLPPLPNLDSPPTSADADDDALRMVRLAISAAYADGAMTEKERAAIVQHATAAGAGDVVQQELDRRRPLSEIVSGVTDPAQRATLYVLAFTLLRADEQVTGAERIYLAQLAALLALDPATVQRLEKDAGERIDALGDQGQLGG